MEKRKTVGKFFSAALREIIDNERRGFQIELAKGAGISKAYVNDILRERRFGSEDIRRKIAEILNTSYEDMLERGRFLIEGDKTRREDDHFEKTRPHSVERATMIFRRAAARYHLDDHWLLSDDVFRRSSPPGWHDYLDRRIGDLELYDIAHREMEKIVEKILSEKRKTEK